MRPLRSVAVLSLPAMMRQPAFVMSSLSDSSFLSLWRIMALNYKVSDVEAVQNKEGIIINQLTL